MLTELNEIISYNEESVEALVRRQSGIVEDRLCDKRETSEPKGQRQRLDFVFDEEWLLP